MSASHARLSLTPSGAAVATILNNPNEWNGKFVPLVGDHLHAEEFVKTFAQVTGQPAKLNSITREAFAGFGFPGAEELAQMFGYFEEYTCFGPDGDLELGKKAHPNLKSFKQWLQETGWKG